MLDDSDNVHSKGQQASAICRQYLILPHVIYLSCSASRETISRGLPIVVQWDGGCKGTPLSGTDQQEPLPNQSQCLSTQADHGKLMRRREWIFLAQGEKEGAWAPVKLPCITVSR